MVVLTVGELKAALAKLDLPDDALVQGYDGRFYHPLVSVYARPGFADGAENGPPELVIDVN